MDFFTFRYKHTVVDQITLCVGLESVAAASDYDYGYRYRYGYGYAYAITALDIHLHSLALMTGGVSDSVGAALVPDRTERISIILKMQPPY